MIENQTGKEAPDVIPSPNDRLADEIADALANAGLITASHQARLLSKLKTGTVQKEDWKLWVDMATAPRSPVEKSDND